MEQDTQTRHGLTNSVKQRTKNANQQIKEPNKYTRNFIIWDIKVLKWCANINRNTGIHANFGTKHPQPDTRRTTNKQKTNKKQIK